MQTTHRWSKWTGYGGERPVFSTRAPEPIMCRVCNIVYGYTTNDSKQDDAFDAVMAHYETDEHFIQMRIRDGLPRLICTLCDPDKEYPGEGEFAEHNQTKKHIIRANRHNGTPICCEICDKDFASTEDKDAHEKTRTHMARTRKNFECKLCDHFKPTPNFSHRNGGAIPPKFLPPKCNHLLVCGRL